MKKGKTAIGGSIKEAEEREGRISVMRFPLEPEEKVFVSLEMQESDLDEVLSAFCPNGYILCVAEGNNIVPTTHKCCSAIDHLDMLVSAIRELRDESSDFGDTWAEKLNKPVKMLIDILDEALDDEDKKKKGENL